MRFMLFFALGTVVLLTGCATLSPTTNVRCASEGSHKHCEYRPIPIEIERPVRMPRESYKGVI